MTAPGTTLTGFSTGTLPGSRPGITFPLGQFSFQIAGVTPGGTTTVTMVIPPDAPAINSYWKYGLRPLSPTPRWFPFGYTVSSGTGATFLPGRIEFIFRDGGRGDTDGTADGVITDPGGPAFADLALLVEEPGTLLVGHPLFVAGADAGGAPVVTAYNPDGSVRSAQVVFDGGTRGGVRVTVGDFNQDEVADTVVGTGPGSPSLVRVLDGVDGRELFRVAPFEAAFLGGVYVAAGDMTGDGVADLVVTPDEGGGPRVTVYQGGTFTLVANFFGIDDTNFRGGARATVGDVTGDGAGDLVISAGFGGGPRISVYDGRALVGAGRLVHPIGDFFLFEQALRNGAFIAVGDVDGDGFADVGGGGGPGGGPRVYAVSGRDLLSGRQTPLANFFAGNTGNRGGIRVAVKDLDGDARADVVVGDGTGAGSHVTAYLGKNFAGGGAPVAFDFDAYPGFGGGVFVG